MQAQGGKAREKGEEREEGGKAHDEGGRGGFLGKGGRDEGVRAVRSAKE